MVELIDILADNGAFQVYTDGSFDAVKNIYSYGVTIVKGQQVIKQLSGCGNTPKYLSSRNVAGEVLGVLVALKYLSKNFIGPFVIFHDYEGLAKWPKLEWKANSPVSIDYLKSLEQFSNIKYSFIKVLAHSGNKFNDASDALAKQAARDYQINNGAHNVMLISGKAGTGKSTYIRLLDKTLNEKKICTVVVAPTGVAAVNVQGVTIHSFFQFPTDVLEPNNFNFYLEVISKSNIKNILALKVLIIDEISMVRVDTIDAIDQSLRIILNNNIPFGGVKVIFVGDLFQLPPVVREKEVLDGLNDIYGGIYFFNAPFLQNNNIDVIELTKNYRQEEEEFIEILDKIRLGVIDESSLDLINTRVVNSGFKGVYLTTTNAIADSINLENLNLLKTESVTYVGKVNGNYSENDFLVNINLILKVGAQVMFLVNNKEQGYYNGTLGTVDKLEEKGVWINLESGSRVLLEPYIWEKIRYTYDKENKTFKKQIVASFTQIPLQLAWAITIHKSQGQTFSNLILDYSHKPFAYGQTYTALSRCKTMSGLYLKQPIMFRDIKVDSKIIDFFRKLFTENKVHRVKEEEALGDIGLLGEINGI